MSRIRSIHPGIFTDEAYMALSLASRELIKGIWCESDDQGVFEWKPLTLKARILPADAVDMDVLLAELIERRFVRRFEYEGRSYGAVRNFRRYQRPKKPNSVHVLPQEFRQWVGLTDTSSEPVPHQEPVEPTPRENLFPTEGEKPPQMEDGGWRKSSEPNGSAATAAPDDPVKALFDFGVAVLGAGGVAERQARSLLGKWRRDAKDDARLMATLVEAKQNSAVEPVAYVERALQRQIARHKHGPGYVPMHPGAGG